MGQGLLFLLRGLGLGSQPVLGMAEKSLWPSFSTLPSCGFLEHATLVCVGEQLPASTSHRSLQLSQGSDRQHGCLGHGKDLENLFWQLAAWLGNTWIRAVHSSPSKPAPTLSLLFHACSSPCSGDKQSWGCWAVCGDVSPHLLSFLVPRS